MLGLGGCHRAAAPGGPEPLIVGKVVTPLVGQSQAQVVALNGHPERRETVDGGDVWIYTRIVPDGVALRMQTAQVWLRDGIVVKVGERTRHWTPNPTFPGPSIWRETADPSR